MIQRFGSDLRLNVHLHALFLDGAFGDDDFFTALAPRPREVEAILGRLVARAEQLLEARADALSITDDEPAHAHREETSGRGAIQRAPDDELDGQENLPTRCKARLDGIDLDAEVAVSAHDHERREALLRHFLRPPLCHDRLRYLPSPHGGVVNLQLEKPWNDRTTHLQLTPHATRALHRGLRRRVSGAAEAGRDAPLSPLPHEPRPKHAPDPPKTAKRPTSPPNSAAEAERRRGNEADVGSIWSGPGHEHL